MDQQTKINALALAINDLNTAHDLLQQAEAWDAAVYVGLALKSAQAAYQEARDQC